ncbi:hypothetical protein RF11_03342 [Thelohanellus kitauei]|uniref:Uncharacterized protein n=1 Tax=Thelohanellus kitauei TaxID=669202 RepID=A0A0C2ML13_THEKT|nr:hypothetical protein RF11_03342 [Thelohanellus kitauei]
MSAKYGYNYWNDFQNKEPNELFETTRNNINFFINDTLDAIKINTSGIQIFNNISSKKCNSVNRKSCTKINSDVKHISKRFYGNLNNCIINLRNNDICDHKKCTQ